MGGKVDDGVVAHLGEGVLGVEGAIEELHGIGNEFAQIFDFDFGEGEAVELELFATEVKTVLAGGEGSGEDAGGFRGLGGELGEGGGGDVVDAIGLDQPVLAVVEGGEGNIAEDAVGGVEDGLGFNGGEVGFKVFEQPGVEFLGDGFGVLAGVLEGGAEGLDRLLEFGSGNVNGVAAGWGLGVGGGEDEFDAIVKNHGIEQDGVGVGGGEDGLDAEEPCHFVGEVGVTGFGAELGDQLLNLGAAEKLVEVLGDFLLELEELVEALVVGGGALGEGDGAEAGEVLADGDGLGEDVLDAAEDELFGVEGGDVAGGGVAADVGEVVVEFLDFEEVEDALGFEDAVLLEEEVGEGAVGVGDGVGVGLLEGLIEGLEGLADGFVGVDGLFVVEDGELGLILLLKQ